MRGGSFQHACNLIVKGLLLTVAGFALGRTETRYWGRASWSLPENLLPLFTGSIVTSREC